MISIKARMLKQPVEVKCQGCGEKINPKGDLSDVEYVKTKRGNEWFFHYGCMKNVWNRKIC